MQSPHNIETMALYKIRKYGILRAYFYKEEQTMIGIKYCGGCNPKYERKEFVNRVMEHFEGSTDFELAKEGTEYSGLMVVGGCSNCCAAYKHFTSLTKPMLIWGDEFFDDVVKGINEILNK